MRAARAVRHPPRPTRDATFPARDSRVDCRIVVFGFTGTALERCFMPRLGASSMDWVGRGLDSPLMGPEHLPMAGTYGVRLPWTSPSIAFKNKHDNPLLASLPLTSKLRSNNSREPVCQPTTVFTTENQPSDRGSPSPAKPHAPQPGKPTTSPLGTSMVFNPGRNYGNGWKRTIYDSARPGPTAMDLAGRPDVWERFQICRGYDKRDGKPGWAIR